MRLTLPAAVAALVLLSGMGRARPLEAQTRPAVPDRRLSQPEARYPEPFSMIGGIRELADGRVMVSDPIEEALVVLNLATGQSSPVGRVGQGPGEYKSPDRLFAMPDGATLLTDLGNGRLSVFGPDGRYRESFPIVVGGAPGGPGGGRPVFLLASHVDAQGRLYFQQPAGGGGPRPADSAAVLRYDRRTSRIDTVAFVKVAPPIERVSGTENNRNVQMSPPTYPRQDAWAVAPDGRLAIVRAADYHVEWVGPGGRLRGQPVALRPVPIRDGEKQEWLDRLGTGLSIAMENRNGEVTTTFSRGRRPQQGPDPDSFTWPDSKPPFSSSSALVTPEGELWVERSVAAGTGREYDTFNAQGAHTGRVLLPAGNQVIGFGRGTVYVVRRDADDLQYLERYRR